MHSLLEAGGWRKYLHLPEAGYEPSSSPAFVFPCWSKETQAMQKRHQTACPFWLTWLTLLMQSKKAFCKGRHEAKHNSSSAHIQKNHSSTKHQAPPIAANDNAWIVFLRSHGFGPFSVCKNTLCTTALWPLILLCYGQRPILTLCSLLQPNFLP